ncbi:exonuclease subunit II [Serratia phage vB_SmaM-Kamaji]|nr:exonuclease subunit II [Serratia phage vB_SmaM-Kamaji]
MEFGGWLSYTSTQKIDFSSNRVTQLIGKNGVGKSTIATVLEETCFNKNSRGIKKDELFAWGGDKHLHSKVEFALDEDIYIITKVVKSTAKVTLTKNGVDISGHTATQTYKVIEDVMGCDFTTFSKLVYQSIKSNLDFLTATDANRKKFLIGLFDQTMYKEMEDAVKAEKKSVQTVFDQLTGEMRSVSALLKAANDIPDVMELKDAPEFDFESHEQRIREHLITIALEDKNKENLVKLDKLQKALDDANDKLSLVDNFSALLCKSDSISKVTRDLAVLESQMSAVKARYKKFKNDADVTDCPTCGTHLDKTASAAAAAVARSEYDPMFKEKQEVEARLKEMRVEQGNYETYQKAKKAAEKAQADYTAFAENISLPDSTASAAELKAEVAALQATVRAAKADIDKVLSHNAKAEVSNARREQLLEQLEKSQTNLSKLQDDLSRSEARLVDLEILSVAYGSKGIVSYKLESCVKTFEDLINKYLSVMTSGKFALGFELDATKLQVVIYNDGYRTSMEGCSSGQQSRISIATLLAIRSLMSAISKVNINLLFLDEVISVIDTDGINTLVELLLEEHELNSIIVSHGYSHPLTAAIEVKQVNGSSELFSAK